MQKEIVVNGIYGENNYADYIANRTPHRLEIVKKRREGMTIEERCHRVFNEEKIRFSEKNGNVLIHLIFKYPRVKEKGKIPSEYKLKYDELLEWISNVLTLTDEHLGDINNIIELYYTSKPNEINMLLLPAFYNTSAMPFVSKNMVLTMTGNLLPEIRAKYRSLMKVNDIHLYPYAAYLLKNHVITFKYCQK